MLSIKVSQLFTIPKGSAITMAVCPKCGSSHIAITRDTDINWGRAIIGWVAFGVVGGAVAGVTGKDRNAVACLDCGASWQPAAVFSIVQLVKEATGKNLDLSLESHRFYLERFFSELSPYIDSEISKAKDRANLIMLKANNDNLGPSREIGTYVGGFMMIWLIGVGLLFFRDNTTFLSIALLLGLLFLFGGGTIGSNIDRKNGWSPETKIKKAEEESSVVIENTKENIKETIVIFSSKYPL